jgi:hypothetical protein
MSTRSTICYTNRWHIYDELMDDTVWLSVSDEDLDFEVDPRNLCVRLPADLAAAIRGALHAHANKLHAEEVNARTKAMIARTKGEEP